MEIKRREKKLKLSRKKKKLKLKHRAPRERRTKSGHFIIEDKHWENRLVPCCNCRHYLESMQMHISKSGEEGWICSVTGEPSLHNEKVICEDYRDDWVTMQRKKFPQPTIDMQPKLKLKRRRQK